MKLIVLISGRLCSGKSLLANNLKEVFSFHKIKTSDIIKQRGEGTLGDQLRRGRPQRVRQVPAHVEHRVWRRDSA